ncbi:hypothetical protein IWQ54_000189 [Labrenzia sp. EL_195]|nr:hypothetical protein [Labrenzia sp. EL_195]
MSDSRYSISGFIIRLISCLFIVAAAGMFYLIYIGRNLYYSQTYNNLAHVLPDIINVWATIVFAAFFFQAIIFFAVPHAKFGAIFALSRRPLFRKLVVLLSAAVLLALFSLVVASSIFESLPARNALYKFNTAIPVMVLGAFCLLSFTYSARPIALFREDEIDWKFRLGALVLAAVLSVLVFISFENLILSKKTVQNTTTLAAASSSHATHSISAIFDGSPARLEPGESASVELRLRLTTFDPNETAKRYPINLDANGKYAVSINLRSVGFDVSELPEFLSSPQSIEVGQLKTWNWTIAPKAAFAGTEQELAVDVFLHDRSTNEMVFQSPVTTLKISVESPFPLPDWASHPAILLLTILLGVVGYFIPWALGQMRLPKKSDD